MIYGDFFMAVEDIVDEFEDREDYNFYWPGFKGNYIFREGCNRKT